MGILNKRYAMLTVISDSRQNQRFALQIGFQAATVGSDDEIDQAKILDVRAVSPEN
jgi:hypothetical protein